MRVEPISKVAYWTCGSALYVHGYVKSNLHTLASPGRDDCVSVHTSKSTCSHSLHPAARDRLGTVQSSCGIFSSWGPCAHVVKGRICLASAYTSAPALDFQRQPFLAGEPESAPVAGICSFTAGHMQKQLGHLYTCMCHFVFRRTVALLVFSIHLCSLRPCGGAEMGLALPFRVCLCVCYWNLTGICRGRTCSKRFTRRTWRNVFCWARAPASTLRNP